MNSKMKEMRIDTKGSVSLEEWKKTVEGVEFGHAELEIVDPKAFEDFLERLPKKPDVSSMFRVKKGK